LKILNLWVDPLSKADILACIKAYLDSGARPHAIFASNPEKNFSVPKDTILYDTYRKADLLIPDGIGMVMAARILHAQILSRVPGSELLFDICELAENKGYPIFIYGAKEEVNLKSANVLQQKYPSLQIAGRSNGYVKDDDMPLLVKKINASGAKILFLALGSPKQEKWFATYKGSLKHVRVCQGVGGTLDTIGGNVKRAPEFWRKKNLEWFYRLIFDPKRIKRQSVLPLFALLVLRDWIRLKFGLSRYR
jgi:N-acetylglucosaminyldiphosphoundecaprenol N-acetyl-beta-D-mannosaminyltransferase